MINSQIIALSVIALINDIYLAHHVLVELDTMITVLGHVENVITLGKKKIQKFK